MKGYDWCKVQPHNMCKTRDIMEVVHSPNPTWFGYYESQAGWRVNIKKGALLNLWKTYFIRTGINFVLFRVHQNWNIFIELKIKQQEHGNIDCSCLISCVTIFNVFVSNKSINLRKIFMLILFCVEAVTELLLLT